MGRRQRSGRPSDRCRVRASKTIQMGSIASRSIEERHVGDYARIAVDGVEPTITATVPLAMETDFLRRTVCRQYKVEAHEYPAPAEHPPLAKDGT
jgi:hypothetical protein